MRLDMNQIYWGGGGRHLITSACEARFVVYQSLPDEHALRLVHCAPTLGAGAVFDSGAAAEERQPRRLPGGQWRPPAIDTNIVAAVAATAAATRCGCHGRCRGAPGCGGELSALKHSCSLLQGQGGRRFGGRWRGNCILTPHCGKVGHETSTHDAPFHLPLQCSVFVSRRIQKDFSSSHTSHLHGRLVWK